MGSLGAGHNMCNSGYLDNTIYGTPTAVVMPQGVISFSQLRASTDGYAYPTYCAIGSDHQLYFWGQIAYGGNGCSSQANVPNLEPLPVGGGYQGCAGSSRGGYSYLCATAYH